MDNFVRVFFMNDRSDSLPELAAEKIIERRDALLDQKGRLSEKRAALLSQMREVDRQLADCRAAARVFNLYIDFPPDEREEFEKRMELRRQSNFIQHGNHIVPKHHIKIDNQRWLIEPVVEKNSSRPPIKNIILKQLMNAGEKGLKAAELRSFIETNYKIIVHEKTVGMTLYRLSKDGVTKRDGRIWFFVSPETKNPGAVTPGPLDLPIMKGGV